MKVTYQSQNYAPEKVLRRYVCHGHDGYQFCEVGADRRYDLRQGTVDSSEIPETVKAAADARKGYWPPYVEWPS